MSKPFIRLALLNALAALPLFAGVYPDAGPANQGASSATDLRNIALGEMRFSDPSLYNLYDQGGSPIGLLDTHTEHVSVGLGLLNSSRSSSGDSLQIGNQNYYLPEVGFFQPGVFAAILYYQRQSESYQSPLGDTLDEGKSLFGFDLAAGPASGLFRIGFGGHALLGGLDYPGGDHRVLLGVPSLRLDVASRPIRDVEVGGFVGFSGLFDSLQNVNGTLERVATLTLPRFGFLADIDSLRGTPLTGNVVLEFGTNRQFGEYRQVNQPGVVYPTIWTGTWDLQTQWLYTWQWNDFHIQPALRFAHASENAQGYVGIKGNQNPFKKGAEIDGMAWTHDINDFGLGGTFAYREMVDLLWEWETAGHTFQSDTTVDRSYSRFSLGVENHLEQIEALRIPSGITLAVRVGWTYRQEDGTDPGYEDYQFDPFLLTSQASGRSGFSAPDPGHPVDYSSFHVGLGAGFLEKRLNLDGLLSFPGRKESVLPTSRSEDITGLEFGLQATLRMF